MEAFCRFPVEMAESVGPGCQGWVEGGRVKSEPDFMYLVIYLFSAAGGRILWRDLEIAIFYLLPFGFQATDMNCEKSPFL